MLPQRHFGSLRSARRPDSFTLVEVVTALGVFLFGIMGVIGLLLTGLQNQHDGIEQTRAIETLREATAAINSQQLVAGTYYMTNGFPGGSSNAGLSWNTSSTTPVNLAPFVVPSPDNNGQIMFVRVTPPQIPGQPLTVYMSVAWPATATTAAGTWTNAQGFQDTYVTVMPPN